MLVVPAAERCYASTLEKVGKENAALLKHEAPTTLKMGLYPVGKACVCEA